MGMSRNVFDKLSKIFLSLDALLNSPNMSLTPALVLKLLNFSYWGGGGGVKCPPDGIGLLKFHI